MSSTHLECHLFHEDLLAPPSTSNSTNSRVSCVPCYWHTRGKFNTEHAMLSLFLSLASPRRLWAHRKQGCCHFVHLCTLPVGLRECLAHCTSVRNACERLPGPQKAQRRFNPFSPVIGTIPGVRYVPHTWMGMFACAVLSTASVLGPQQFSPLIYSWALEVAPGFEVTRVLWGAWCQSWAGGLLLPQGCIVRLPGMSRQKADDIAAPCRHPQGALNSEGWQGESSGEGIRSRCIMPGGIEPSFTGGGKCLRRDKPRSYLLVFREERCVCSNLTGTQVRPAATYFSQRAGGSAGLDNLWSSSN